ncbi:anthranilate synthase component II [Virgibacillus siamensis]|uniref:anthranilate synthase component II n=1 Tax=Virgibacillus siamensis TaxID=480071 RepID=UPI0009849BBA|nr:aminodeoxychorismate/anthranilate synthase component II [Virgibacillus siamensis]
MIVLIDNYDSFTYNLAQYIEEFGQQVLVARNDVITIGEIEHMRPAAIVLSPGPGNPGQAGICLELVRKLHNKIPILGICLGHQIIAQAFGATIEKAAAPMHGKVSYITHDGKGIFHSLDNPLRVTRYHSLLVDAETIPDCLEISASTNNGEIMAIRHKTHKIEGIQAHPEAILTDSGKQLLKNFFNRMDGEINGHSRKAISII